jgi:VanZ family protein
MALRYLRLWRALGGLLVLAVIWLSLTPAPPMPEVAGGDKIGHVAAYAALMLWFSQLHPGFRVRLGWAVGFVALGIALEFAQLATRYRSFEIADMAADAIGVCLGWAAAPPRLPNFLGWIEGRLGRASR